MVFHILFIILRIVKILTIYKKHGIVNNSMQLEI